jgi:hypothetical protein
MKVHFFPLGDALRVFISAGEHDFFVTDYDVHWEAASHGRGDNTEF